MIISPISFSYLLHGNILYEYATQESQSKKKSASKRSSSTGSFNEDFLNDNSVYSSGVNMSKSFDGYGPITHAYPLVNIVVAGPVASDNGKFMISISDKCGGLLRVNFKIIFCFWVLFYMTHGCTFFLFTSIQGVKRCEDTGRLIEYLKPDKLLILLLNELDVALAFKAGLEAVTTALVVDDLVTNEV